MKLPIPSFSGKKQRSEYYLALLLRDEKASALILEETNGKITVVGKHEEYFTTSLESATAEEWLEVLDRTISKAEETLSSDVETQKTVFGVKESWVEEKKIKKDYLTKLKKVCDNLDLSPIGFLVINEAIVHLIQEEEGAPVSAILAELQKKAVTLTLLRASKIVEEKSIEIGVSLAETVDSLLKQFHSVDVFPSRIIIFDGGQEELLGQSLITHQWSKSLPFLHMPQISVLPTGFDAKAVVFGAAEQMGFDVLDITSANDIKNLGKTEELQRQQDEKQTPAADAPLQQAELASEDKKAVEDNTAIASMSSFGFVVGKDVGKMPATNSLPVADEKKDMIIQTVPKQQEEINEKNIHANIIPAHFEETENAKENIIHEDTTHDKEIDTTEADEGIQNKKRFSGGDIIIGKLFRAFQRIPTRVLSLSSKMKFPALSMFGGNKFIFIAPVILLLLIGSIVWYIFSVHATVTIHVKPNNVSQDQTIIFSLTSPNDFSQNTIAVKTITAALSGEDQTAATGKKEVGDPAKGTITIYNSSDNPEQLSAGTTITSANGLNFTTDKNITIASSSGDIFSGIQSGTAQVSITAKNIGPEYNLPSSTKFTFGNSITLAAKNDNAFSGGSKKNITVVAKADLDKLASDLIKNQQDKSQQELQQKVAGDQTLLPIVLSTSLDNKKYDKKVGDEVKTVSLTADVTANGVAYQNNDMQQFAEAILKNKYANNLNISKNGVQATLHDLKQKDANSITATASIKAGLLPKLDSQTITQDITGKSFTVAENYLQNLPQVADAQIQLSPNIPFLPKMLPRIHNHIAVVLNTND